MSDERIHDPQPETDERALAGVSAALQYERKQLKKMERAGG